MGKGEELTTTKYLIHAEINANGIVEKPDVVGAVFGLVAGDVVELPVGATGVVGVTTGVGVANKQFVITSYSGSAIGLIVGVTLELNPVAVTSHVIVSILRFPCGAQSSNL